MAHCVKIERHLSAEQRSSKDLGQNDQDASMR
jgi:hypothetical protein